MLVLRTFQNNGILSIADTDQSAEDCSLQSQSEMTLILTPNVPLSLLELCMARTGALLRDGYYQQVSENKNPFRFCPPEVVGDLFRLVSLAEEGRYMTKFDMYRPLLTSGRITDLDFPFEFGVEDCSETLRTFLQKSNVRKLCMPVLLEDKDVSDWLKDIVFIWEIQNFVLECSNVEYLSIPGEAYDDSVLLRHPKLKKLVVVGWKYLNYLPSQLDSTFIHYNLTEISMGPFEHSPECIAGILEYCPNLVSMENNVAGAMELLHGRKFKAGVLKERYKLRHYHLEFRGHTTALSIASVTCPSTTELYMRFHSEILPDMKGLANFAHLESLALFHSGLDALKQIGSQIKHLHLSYVNLDLEVIGICCPNLTYLKVIYDRSHDILNPSAEYFVKLEVLSLECDHDHPRIEHELQFLLSSCKGLHTLHLTYVECLTDKLLGRLLQKNSLSRLKDVKLNGCSLSQQGIQQFLENCRCLEKISISSFLVWSGDVLEIVKYFYPNARFQHCSDDPILEMLHSFPITERNYSTELETDRSLGK